jgi:hypothetical protein
MPLLARSGYFVLGQSVDFMIDSWKGAKAREQYRPILCAFVKN